LDFGLLLGHARSIAQGIDRALPGCVLGCRVRWTHEAAGVHCTGRCVGDEQSAMTPDVPIEDERLEFLRHAIALSEWNIRTLDTKAQISIVGFVLSLNPLWSILTSTCPRAASSMVVAILLMLFVATVLLLAFVFIVPVTSMRPKATGGWPKKGLFSAGDPNLVAAGLPADRIGSPTSEVELAAETLDLAHVREIKSRRFKHALRSVFVFYAWSVATFLMLRNCGAAAG